MNKGDILKLSVNDMLKNDRIDIEFEESKSNNIKRYKWIRRIDNSYRYLRITPINIKNAAWDYEILGGAYRAE
ncbi:MAG: hypothetical protein GY751_22965, partial [Bacteroidetes bacterium]|nr:hypothetical protein [Bacteroidota bacterium]